MIVVNCQGALAIAITQSFTRKPMSHAIRIHTISVPKSKGENKYETIENLNSGIHGWDCGLWIVDSES